MTFKTVRTNIEFQVRTHK